MGDIIPALSAKIEWVLSSVPEGEWEQIHRAVQRGHLTGCKELQLVAARFKLVAAMSFMNELPER
jgi:hypothetical protein